MSAQAFPANNQPSKSTPHTASEPTSAMAASSSAINGTDKEWDSERHVVAALASLRELHSELQNLRNLLPNRLLSPLIPLLSNSNAYASQAPKSPQLLFDQLANSASNGFKEVEDLKRQWQTEKMEKIWERVKKEAAVQGRGAWDEDYAAMLAEIPPEDKSDELVKDEDGNLEITGRGEEEEWKDVLEKFRNENPSFKIEITGTRDSHDETGRLIAKVAGIVFKIERIEASQEGTSSWAVMNKEVDAKTKLEGGILRCLNSRQKKSDLAFLLDMLASYSDVKKTPCKKCGKLLNDKMQLPTVRTKRSAVSTDGKEEEAWEVHHEGCPES